MPDVFADMMKIAKVIDLSPAERAFSAIQEPLTGSFRLCEYHSSDSSSKYLRHMLEQAMAAVKIPNLNLSS